MMDQIYWVLGVTIVLSGFLAWFMLPIDRMPVRRVYKTCPPKRIRYEYAIFEVTLGDVDTEIAHAEGSGWELVTATAASIKCAAGSVNVTLLLRKELDDLADYKHTPC